MSSKRPFRLGLKSKSADTEYTKNRKSSNGSSTTYTHPLAGQQQQQQFSSKRPVQQHLKLEAEAEADPQAGPSWSRESLVDPIQDIKQRDSETLSVTNGWFRSLSADEESLYSSHSPNEADLGTFTASLQKVVSEQKQQDESTSREFSVLRPPDQQGQAPSTPDRKQAELLRMARDSKSGTTVSPVREGGILGRLKRISKKEKSRAVREEGEEAAGVSSSSSGLELERVSTLTVDEEKESALLPAPLSSANVRDIEKADPMLLLRKAASTKTPKLERPKGDRIQSIQPSLVGDDASIFARQSIAGSQVDFDEEDLRERLLLSGHRPPSLLQSEQGQIEYMEEDDDDEDREDTSDTDPDLMLVDRSIGLSFDSPLMDVEASTPGENIYSEAGRSEYANVASRQPSSYDSLRRRLTNDTSDEQDEEAVTPKGVPEGNGSDYFSVGPIVPPPASIARSSAASMDTTATPTKAMPVKKYTWYQAANLKAQQRHYFLRHVLSRELQWEYERLFLISNTSSLFQPLPRDALPRSDIAYFKKEAKGLNPDLPLIRFLYTHVLSTCPLFGPAQPIEGAAAMQARKQGARNFLDEAILPLLRFQQEASLNRGVDIYGEWPDEYFDSPCTTGVMKGSIFKALVKLLAAAVPDEKSRSLPWSDVAVPSSATYIRHRVAPSKLKQGGMEVNIVGARMPSSSKECELLLSVRRFGFPPHFVVRSESDFYDYALRLAEELGRKMRIRAVPPPAGQEMLASSAEAGTGSSDHSSNGSSTKKSRPADPFYSRRNTSQSSLQSLAQPKPVRVDSSDSLARLKGRNSSTVSIGSSSSSRRGTESPQQSGQATAAASNRTSTLEKTRFLYRSKAESSTDTDVNSSRTSLNSSVAHQSRLFPPMTRNDEARRKQLRAWLRDALSVRGAGHAKETKAFLETGSFSEKEIKAGTKKDIENRARIDAKLIREREVNASNASDEILELQREMKALWQDCIDNEGVLKALEAVRTHDTFSALPLPYQRVISWTNLHLAQFLHHVFLNSHEARANFDRATELLQCIPWTTLSLALREPTGLMMQKVKSSLSSDFVIKKILALQLEDVPVRKIELEISSLKNRLGSTIMRKLEGYVNSAEWQKRVIRKASKRNNIPLVAAIVRGDDKPLLAADGIKRVMTATRVHQEFMKTHPSYEERRAKALVNYEVRLINDMQRALKLLSLRRNGFKIREALSNQLRKPVEAFLEPFFSLLKRLHRSRILTKNGNGGIDVIMDFQVFLYKLFDVLAGLKIRIQDPWRSLSTLTLFLDDAIPSWYHLLHQFANNPNDSAFLQDITQWLQSICSLLSQKRKTEGDANAVVMKMEEEVAPYWQPPKGGLNQADTASISELIQIAQINKSRMMESACRWAAGDVDADYSIQLLGEGGKTRVTPFHLNQEFAPPPTSLAKQDALDVYLPGLRSALSHFM